LVVKLSRVIYMFFSKLCFVALTRSLHIPRAGLYRQTAWVRIRRRVTLRLIRIQAVWHCI